MDATTLAIVIAIIPAAAVIVSQAIQQYLGNARAKADHAHELRRDQIAKYYEFRLQEYRERTEACQSLMLAAYRTSIAASTGQGITEFMPYFDHAQKILSIDERADKVRQAATRLPVKQLYTKPDDNGVKQAWSEAVRALSLEVSDYLRALRRTW